MKYLVLLFFFSLLLFSSEIDKIESKIIMRMIDAVSSHKILSIYTNCQKLKEILPAEKIIFVDDCSDANLAILEKSKIEKNCTDIPIITLEYDLLKKYPNSIGSFFWQKGRPNIIFIKSRLENQNIDLDNAFDEFIEENIW
ncbi:MAG: hypothetical protein Q7S59_07655 [Sulfurimonas sp.]|nr:hypothetical protein [Sulfurimonas sp.]